MVLSNASLKKNSFSTQKVLFMVKLDLTYINPLLPEVFLPSYFEIYRKIGSPRLPTHRRHAHRNSFFFRWSVFCLFISRTEGKIRMNNMQEDNLSRVLCTKSGMQLNIKTTKTLQNGVSKCLHKSTRITYSFQNNKHNISFPLDRAILHQHLTHILTQVV